MNSGVSNSLQVLPELRDEEFILWQKLLETRTGICVAEHRRQYIKTCLGIRMRELGINNYTDYYHQVVNGAAGAVEWNLLLDRVTVKETRFFRDSDALNLVSDYLSSLVNRNNKAIDMWSVGCSTGEEVYSLAMIANKITAGTGSSYSITGTDISGQALKTALCGHYSDYSVQHIPHEYQSSSIKRCESGGYLISPALKDRCCFTQLNLDQVADFISQPRDLIYCQNVLIYFRKWKRRDILNSLVANLLPGGLLITGIGEAVDWKHPNMESIKIQGVNAFIKDGSEFGSAMIMGTARR